MRVKCNVGHISVSPKGVYWLIPNFYALPQIRNTAIKSPSFSFRNSEWHLYVHPCGFIHDRTLGWFGIHASDCTNSDEHIIELGIIDENRRIIVRSRAERKAKQAGYADYPCLKLIRRRKFNSLKEHVVPNGNLHIFLNIVSVKEDYALQDVWMKNDGMKEYEQTSAFTEPSIEMQEISVKEYEQTSAFTEQSIKMEEISGFSSLKQDLENLLLNENITDIVLKVADQEFKAHRCILAARSPVFLAMMTNETHEKVTGVVIMEDVDPCTIRDFLHYLYTENVENITPEKALKLYPVAEKYQVNELKQHCLSHLLTNMSIDIFCDVLRLSVQHNEGHLKDACNHFFLEKSLDIVMSTNWQIFLCENPVTANELFIKHLKLIKSECCKQ